MIFSIMSVDLHFTSQWSDTIFRFRFGICNSFTWEIVSVWPFAILYFQIVSQAGLQWTMQFKGPIVSCSLILIIGLLCTFGGSNLILSGPSEIYVQVFIKHTYLLIFFQNKCCKMPVNEQNEHSIWFRLIYQNLGYAIYLLTINIANYDT